MDDEALKEFVIEGREGLDQLDREFLALEADPTATGHIAIVFRTFHTIKGSAGFLGLGRLEKLAHAAENVLVELRDGRAQFTRDLATCLLAVVDRLRQSLTTLEASGVEGSEAHDDLIAWLGRIQGAERGAPEGQTAPATLPRASAPPNAAPSVAPSAETVSPAAAARPVPTAPAAVAPAEHATVAESNVRVDVGLLDRLMNIVGELVLVRNQIVQFGTHREDPAFAGAAQRLNLITTELQEQVMKTRMQPIGSVWSKLPRVVRDLAIACGKQVRVEMRGKETELDRTILDAIKDPLTHIVRNAVDHGLESPQARVDAKKPRTGTLVLRGYHEGGQVIVEVSDDGAGLDLNAIRRRAIERRLVTEEGAARLTAFELGQLVFLPGFSTAAKVTNLSGRGVGMDVVKSNVERIGGTVDLHSQPGQGTTVQIRIPLTLAIVPALVVHDAGQRFAIPQANLVELVHLEADSGAPGIEYVREAPVVRLRGQLVPIVTLRALFGAAPRRLDAAHGPINLVILQANDRRFALVVDEIRDTQEIVVKPLGKELKALSTFAGATIMGDGKVALILDVVGLAQQSGLARARGERAAAQVPGAPSGQVHEVEGSEHQTLLLFTVGGGSTLAVPLARVARLEDVHRERFERSGDRWVVQSRGELLPIISLVGPTTATPAELPVTAPVIVHSSGTRSIGFLVGSIVDVVNAAVAAERCNERRGLKGATVVHGRVTDLLDVDAVIAEQAPWFEREADA
ncbi:MAG: chemotaxis protein CheW [Myxococcaceae bacterium]|nr:chemotaxis protein CheW [Myxococcaceae bacterium]